MVETQYKEIKENPKFPVKNLIKILGDRKLIASLEAFGPDYFKDNVEEMQKQYSHPQTRSIITFREPTTAESILAAAYDFENRAKPQILDPNWLQAGRIFKASEWVVVNPPIDKQGDFIKDEKILKNYLNKAEEINGIYRIPNGKIKGVRDCSFVPYESFKEEVQSSEDFARSGIARGLEYVEGDEAPKLKSISAKKNYPKGVNVFGFNPEGEIRVVGLGSGRFLGDGRLGVGGDDLSGGSYCYAFGVLNKSAEGAAPKK